MSKSSRRPAAWPSWVIRFVPNGPSYCVTAPTSNSIVIGSAPETGVNAADEKRVPAAPLTLSSAPLVPKPSSSPPGWPTSTPSTKR